MLRPFCLLHQAMTLTRDQLESIVARALPGERLTSARPLPGDRWRLALASGDSVDLQRYATPEAAATAVAALRRLRAEVDLPLPQLRASDAAGDVVGVPYALLSPLEGEPLASLPPIPEEPLYELGRRIGEVAYRVHRLACPRYGPLAGEQGEASAASERDYVLARLDADLRALAPSGLLDAEAEELLRAWFDQQFRPASGGAALVCGGLTLGAILVRRSGASWSLGGLIGWDAALGWSPGWDHAIFLDSARGPGSFALRVGYGNGYDGQNQRPHEQVREQVLRPYRMLLLLRQLRDARGPAAEIARRRSMLLGLARFEEHSAGGEG